MDNVGFVIIYPSEWLSGTVALNAEERGVYMTLLCLLYEENGNFNISAFEHLAKACGVTKPAFEKAFDTLVNLDKIILSDDGNAFNARDGGLSCKLLQP